jgi:chromosome partitioning protein
MATKVFSIANQKGGVGKSTTAINLSVGLAKKGISTLLIDLDPQANATSGLGFAKEPGKSIYGPLHGEGVASDFVMETSQENLFLLPSEVDLAAIEVELGQKENYLGQLHRCIEPLKKSGKYKVVIIDCPPALGLLSLNALAAADYLIIALQCEYLAMEGLQQITKVLQDLKTNKINSKLDIGGILMTMYDVRTNLSNQVVDEVRKHYKDLVFKNMIPRSIRLSEAPSFGQSIFDYDPLSPGATAYKKFAEELMKRFEIK